MRLRRHLEPVVGRNAVTAMSDCRHVATLVPGEAIKGSLWTLITCNFIETSVFALALDIASILVLLRLAEPAFGTPELCKLIALAATASGSACFLAQYAVFLVTRRGSGLFVERCSFAGILGALTICTSAVYQADALPLPRKALPAAFFAACVLLGMVVNPLVVLPMALTGMATGHWWVLNMAPEHIRGAQCCIRWNSAKYLMWQTCVVHDLLM